MFSFKPRSVFFCVLLGVLFLVPGLQAQFMTNVKLNKETYLTFEPVEATVTISNRSGADVVMGGPNGMSWMTFEVTSPGGNQQPPMRIRSDESILFKSGTTISRKVIISQSYSFSDYGPYTIAASIYHPPSQQYYASNRTRANFTDARPFWEQSYGVPAGLPNAGQIRRYTLSMLRDLDHTYLYVRLLEENTKLKLATFSLGTCIMVNDPQITVDSDNKLHVLFMTIPHVYAYVTVDTQGRVTQRSYYRELQTNRPQLIVQGGGVIAVQGGAIFDPSAPPPDEATQGRSIGVKPPGL